LTALLIEAARGRTLDKKTFEALIGRFAENTKAPAKQLVLIAARNRIGSVAALYGAWRAGHAVFLADGAAPMHWREWIERYQPDMLVLPQDGEFRPDATYAPCDEIEDVRLYKRAHAEQAPHPDLALLLTTSGSTGSRKLVRLARQNIEANTQAIIAALGITAADRAAVHMPLAYSYGFSVMHTHITAGAGLVFVEDGMTVHGFWQALGEHHVTTLPGVPYHFEMMEKLGLERLKIPALRVMTQAGGAMEPARVRRFAVFMHKRGGKFFVMYGQTEAAPRMSVLPAERAADKPDSAGLPLSGGAFAIESGEIIYRGPNVMMGYAENRADLTRGDEMKGRLATGDLGHLDDEGYLFITGRKQPFAKIDGWRIDLAELEQIAGQMAPTIAFEHEGQLMLFTTGEPEAVRGHVARHVHVHASRIVARHLAAFPRLANSKIDRQGLRKHLS
jgi:acyl-CoA synthetase (AMP-forming)/AMP-acid ligase II